jgi:hypothetical protein
MRKVTSLRAVAASHAGRGKLPTLVVARGGNGMAIPLLSVELRTDQR